MRPCPFSLFLSGFEHQALFAEGALPVLCATTGLAQGVNLPARLVVLMNTAKYSSAAGGYEEYTRIETMQMAGRAGRPQFDDQGVCVVMTREGMREHYERMLRGTETIESHMHEGHLMLSHLNAEIAAAGTYMPDIAVCLRWLKSTFLYVRMRASPTSYKLRPGLDASGLDTHLKSVLTRNLARLAEHGMIRFRDDGMSLEPLLLGQIMARFVVDFDTVSSFRTIDATSNLETTVSLLARATEFATPLCTLTRLRRRRLSQTPPPFGRLCEYPQTGHLQSNAFGLSLHRPSAQ